MNIIVSCKIVPDDQDIQVAPDRTLDYSKAKGVVSAYDLNAIEAAAQLAAGQDGSKVVAIAAGPASIDDSKIKKNVLARGVDELVMCADDACGNMDAHATANPVRLVSSKPIEKSGVDLGKADVVVAAGRGFAEEADLDLARALCDKLGAGLACSRPLTEGVDWLPAELYVGVSGLMLSPKAYVACGISGQMQHMVGCNRAGTMFAINKDKNAPVFKQCDYGLVGDVKDVLPALAAAL